MTQWNIGCSGFHYKHWKGTFYPEDLPQKKWFDYYCQHFNTLELNVTFYRFPQLSFLQTWYDKSPDSFRFAVKAPRAITHFKKFLNSKDMLYDFYGIVNEGLKEKVGCFLFQLPPNYTYSEERLERLLTNLDPGVLNVAEFREASWWNETVYKELAAHNISFCGMSHPTLPRDIICNTPVLYYRMHGEGQLYASNYTDKELQSLARKIKTTCKAREAFIYFNNDIHTYAIGNALKLISIV